MDEARFPFDPAGIDPNEPPENDVRLIWLFLSFLRKREVRYETYYKECRFGMKTFKRDLDKLRAIGERYGFALSRQRKGLVRLAALENMPDHRRRAMVLGADTLRALADAFGEVVGHDVADLFDLSTPPDDPFLHLATPRLASQSEVALTFSTLRRAWEAHARVRFLYPRAGAGAAGPEFEERTVEPHRVTYYDGRYYLVAYDARPRTAAWRQFALDRIAGTIALGGTFGPRPIPPNYRGDDALGLFKTGPATEVTIALAPDIANAVIARRWQRAQRVEVRPGEWTLIHFDVYDLGEAVRWALRLGDRARVVAPPPAVDLARRIVATLFERYLELDVSSEFESRRA